MAVVELKRARPKAVDDEVSQSVSRTVTDLLTDIRARGEAAVRQYSEKFDGWDPPSFRLTAGQIDDLTASLPKQVIADISFVQDQVRRFAQVQRDSLRGVEVETLPGVFLGQRHLPVGLSEGNEPNRGIDQIRGPGMEIEWQCCFQGDFVDGTG